MATDEPTEYHVILLPAAVNVIDSPLHAFEPEILGGFDFGFTVSTVSVASLVHVVECVVQIVYVPSETPSNVYEVSLETLNAVLGSSVYHCTVPLVI